MWGIVREAAGSGGLVRVMAEEAAEPALPPDRARLPGGRIHPRRLNYFFDSPRASTTFLVSTDPKGVWSTLGSGNASPEYPVPVTG
jgi:hypothetical protein